MMIDPRRLVEGDPGRAVMMPDGDVRESYPFWGRDGAVAYADWLGRLLDAEVTVEHDPELAGEFGEWSVLVVTPADAGAAGGGHAA